MTKRRPFLLMCVCAAAGCGPGAPEPAPRRTLSDAAATAVARERVRRAVGAADAVVIETTYLPWNLPAARLTEATFAPSGSLVVDRDRLNAIVAELERLRWRQNLGTAESWGERIYFTPMTGGRQNVADTVLVGPAPVDRSSVMLGENIGSVDFDAATPDAALVTALLAATADARPRPVDPRIGVGPRAAAHPYTHPARLPHDVFAAAEALQFVSPEADRAAVEVRDTAALAELAALVPTDAKITPARPAVMVGRPPITVGVVPGEAAPDRADGGAAGEPVWFHVTPAAILFQARSRGFDLLYSLPLPDAALHDRLRALQPPAPPAAGSPPAKPAAGQTIAARVAAADRLVVHVSPTLWWEPQTDRSGIVPAARVRVTDRKQMTEIAVATERLTFEPADEPEMAVGAEEWIELSLSVDRPAELMLFPAPDGRSLVFGGEDPRTEAVTPDDALHIALLRATAASAGSILESEPEAAGADGPTHPFGRSNRFPHDRLAAASGLRLVGPEPDRPAAEVTDAAVLAQIAALVPADAQIKPARPAVIAGPPPISVQIADAAEGDGPAWYHVTPTALLFLDRAGEAANARDDVPPKGRHILYSLPLPDAALHDRLRALQPAAPPVAGSPTAARPAR